MKQHRAPLLAALVLLAALAGCGGAAGPAGGAAGQGNEDTGGGEGAAQAPGGYAEEDYLTGWDSDTATQVLFDGTAVLVDGREAAGEGGLTITAAGTYVLTGSLDDGQLIVDAGKNDRVRLIFNGVELNCSTSAPVWAKQAGKVIVTLAEGTENTLTDGADYGYAQGEDEPDAALFSKDDLTLNGSGSLTVTGSFNNGIGTKDNLVITGGSYRIAAAGDGLRGRDSVSIAGGQFTIDAACDGIKSNNDEDAAKGWVALDGGVFVITAGNDGVQAETALTVAGGDYTLTTGGGSANASVKDGQQNRGWGSWGGNTSNDDTADDVSDSAKGLKAGTALTIQGGSFAIDASDDALHSNGDLTINGGELELATGDDGAHADKALLVTGGTIAVSQSYEGLEGASVTITGGDISIKSGDDGINAAGGSDETAAGPGRDSFAQDGDYFIRISGGRVDVDASGDGLDSNGGLYLEGGSVTVSGPTGGGNSALDFDGSCEMTGGVLAAAGSAGMAQAPGSASTQPVVMVYYAAPQEAGSAVVLRDSGGSELLSYAPSKEYQSAVLSAPGLELGGTYSLYSGGTKLCDLTLSETVTAISDDGSAAPVQGGGMGGGGFPGGRPGGGRGETAPPEGGAPAPPQGQPPGESPAA